MSITTAQAAALRIGAEYEAAISVPARGAKPARTVVRRFRLTSVQPRTSGVMAWGDATDGVEGIYGRTFGIWAPNECVTLAEVPAV